MVRSTLVPLLLFLLACAAPPLLAEEPPAEQADAAEIGRGLLSPEAEIRRRAQARLLERVRRGGDLEAFVRAMSDGVAAWANDHERLMEVWLHQAVHGNDEVRERAVRLLAALGAPAIRRLSLELRHSLQHGSPPGSEAAGPQEPAPQGTDVPTDPTNESVAGTPRLYELKDLVAAGLNAVELRSLLLKAADASEVRRYGTHFIVTASEAGHAALYARLNEMRSERKERSGAAQVTKPEAAADDAAPASAPPQRPRAPAGESVGGSTPPLVAGAAPAKESARPEAADRDRPALALARVWLVRPLLLVHLPREARMPGLWTDDGQAGARLVTALPPSPSVSLGRARVRAGTQAQVELWSGQVRRIPDARPEEPAMEKPFLLLGENLHVFSGRELRYSKDVRQIKGGAWTLLTDTILHGIAVDLSLTPSEQGVHVSLSATSTEVGLPIPVLTVQPAPDAAPVELERPEWSTTRQRVAFDLPPNGGGAVVSLDGLGTPESERLLLVLGVAPVPDPAALRAVRAR